MPAVKRVAAVVAGLAAIFALRIYLERHLAERPIYAYDFEWFLKLGPGEAHFLAVYVIGGALATAILAYGLAPPAVRAGRRLLGTALGRFWIPAMAAGVLVWGIAQGVLGQQVLTDDEYVYLFQARTLLAGHLVLPAPALPEFYTNVFVVARDGRWFGQYPPGHPLLLAPALALGWPRLLPMLLAALNLGLIARITQEVAGRAAAGVTALALLCSPFYLLTGSTLLSHPTALFGLSLAAWGAVRAPRHPGWRTALWVGAGVGLTVITRPWTGVTLGLFPLLGWAVPALREKRAQDLMVGLGVLGMFGAAFLGYNHAVTGQALTTGYEAIRGTGMSEFGFISIVPGIHAHTPAQGLQNVAILAARFLVSSWGWPFALIPAVWAFRAGGASPRTRWVVGAAAGMIVAGLLSYLPYWSVGVHDSGPVKTYELLLPFGVLTGAGAATLARRRPRATAGWLAASVFVAGLIYWPIQVDHLREVSRTVREPLELIAREVEPPAVVFVANMQPPRARSWVFGRPNPAPDLSDEILLVRDLGPQDVRYARSQPRRRPYRLLVEDGEFKVVPLFAKER